jgi:class 3 adenylate cyclase
VARLDSTNRASLPDSAFAYIDSRGRRRLPINDEAHVRNALSRFNQVRFEDEQARDRARTRLLNAAKRYKIVPVGFITGQLQSERQQPPAPVELPGGFVTMLMTDVEGSTALVQRLGVRYRELIEEVRAMLATAAVDAGGRVVETRADDFFAVFEGAPPALAAAVDVQRRLGARPWGDDLEVRVRAGVHSGEPTQTESNYIGLPVHTAARICAAAHGGQILVSADTRKAARGAVEGIRFRTIGAYRLRGLPEPVELFQVTARGLATRFPPPRTGTAPPG